MAVTPPTGAVEKYHEYAQLYQLVGFVTKTEQRY